VLAEELGRSTYGGFAITVLVHTDMASPHLFHAGSAEQLARYMPDIISGRRIAAVAMTEPNAGSISKSFEEDDEAGKLDKAEEIVGVVLPANEDPALPLNPGEEALDEPAAHVAA
jgi:hypothetical protein